jgi:hypothetical protein
MIFAFWRGKLGGSRWGWHLETGWKPASGERKNCRDPLKNNLLARLEAAKRRKIGHQ